MRIRPMTKWLRLGAAGLVVCGRQNDCTGKRRSQSDGAQKCDSLGSAMIFRLGQRFVWLLAPIIWLCGSSVRADQLEVLAAKSGIRIVSVGESSAELQKKAASQMPLNLMTTDKRQRAQKLLQSCNQYRKLPTLQYSIDEPIYRYLLQHPDVAVSTWRVMGISRFEMLQTGPLEYEAHAIDGSEGIADILYQDAAQTIFVCEGNYHNVLLPKPIEASALIWFRAHYAPGADGTHVVSQRADVFVRFPSTSISTLAKMLTPVTNTMMDRNVLEISLYASMMSRAVRDEPEWVVQVAQQLEGVMPQRRVELTNVARQPRRMAPARATTSNASQSVDRELIHSPELLFFDPPKQGSTIQGKTVEVKPASDSSSGSRIQFIPASRATRVIREPRLSDDNSVTSGVQTGDEMPALPAAPPAGSTATDPAGTSILTPMIQPGPSGS
jgi:hypothetical protein